MHSQNTFFNLSLNHFNKILPNSVKISNFPTTKNEQKLRRFLEKNYGMIRIFKSTNSNSTSTTSDILIIFYDQQSQEALINAERPVFYKTLLLELSPIQEKNDMLALFGNLNENNTVFINNVPVGISNKSISRAFLPFGMIKNPTVSLHLEIKNLDLAI